MKVCCEEEGCGGIPDGGGDFEDGVGGVGGSAVLIRIHVPDLNIHKCLQFYKHDLVWDVKAQCLASLPKELKESFNYGLFLPPHNGKAGKFLEEERPLSDYPFSGPVGYLELRYKRRLYKGLSSFDDKALKSLHTKSNLRRFLDYVSSGHTDKIGKLCGKGLDPNFHCHETGETPLAMAALMKKPVKLLITLVNGGALLDYRTKDGATAMHRAVEAKSWDAVKTLLDLGGSPNYRDGRGLTPLYLSVSLQADPKMTQLLLHDHAFLGSQDSQGWQEVHQACRTGLIQHLEHLLFYGADMNARNASGNTPLHVCAVNNQESAARLLLFRGADKDALNFANQTPYQMAVIAGNMDLAEIIQAHRSADAVPYRDLPKYNPRRRRSSLLLPSSSSSSRSHHTSMSSLVSSFSSLAPSGRSSPFKRLVHHRDYHESPLICHSPCPSNRSLPQFSTSSSASSSCFSSCSSTFTGFEERGGGSGGSEGSNYSSISIIHQDHNGSRNGSDFFEDSALGSFIGDRGGSSTAFNDKSSSSNHTHPGGSDITSDSSGLGTSHSNNSHSSSSYENAPTLNKADTILGRNPLMVVCVENFSPSAKGQLKLAEGDMIEVTGSVEGGAWLEGSLRGSLGLFPSACVQEIRVKGRNSTTKGPPKKIVWGESHTVILHKGVQGGFGFILRGAKADSPLMDLEPNDRFPALQYLDDVDPGSVADRAGLRKGDFILAINSQDVSHRSHEVVVDMIRKSGELVSLTVKGLLGNGTHFEDLLLGTPSSPASASLTNNSATNGAESQQTCHFATLPRKHSSSGSGNNVPSPPRRDPGTSLSVGRTRAKSMVAALADMTAEQGSSEANGNGNVKTATSADSISGKPPLPPGASSVNVTNGSVTNGGMSMSMCAGQKTASIRARPPSSTGGGGGGGGGANNSNKFGTWNGPPHRIYASVAEMKRFKTLGVPKPKDPSTTPSSSSTLHKDFHSTPDLKAKMNGVAPPPVTNGTPSTGIPRVRSLSQENLNKLLLRNNQRHSWTFPSKPPSEDLPAPPTESELREATKDGESGSSSSGSETENEDKPAPLKPKVLTLGDGSGEYRSVTKPLRPVVQSKTLPRRASTGATISPAEQATIMNLVPPGQLIKVDVGKNTTSSSLNKDQYATLAEVVAATNQALKAQGPPQAVSVTSASAAGLMSSFKPNDSAKLYASPDDLKSIGYRGGEAGADKKSSRSQSLPPPKDGLSKPEVVDPQKSLQEAKEKLRPVKPALKSTNSTDKIRLEVKQSPRLGGGGRREKTVTFQQEEGEEDPSSSPPDTPNVNMAHSMSVDEFTKVKGSLKSSTSFPNDLGADDGNTGPSSSDAKYVTNLPVGQEGSQEDTGSEDSSDKTWILKDDSTTSDSVQTVVSALPSKANLNDDFKISNLEATNNKKQTPLSASAQLGITPTTLVYGGGRLESTYGTISRTLNNSNNLALLRQQQQLQLSQLQALNKNAALAKVFESEASETEGSGRNTPIQQQMRGRSPAMYHTLQPQRSRSMVAHSHSHDDHSHNVNITPSATPPPQQHLALAHQYHLQQQQIAARQLQQLQMAQAQQQQMHMQGQGSRQAEKSIEESLKLIQMHVAALKQDFPNNPSGGGVAAPPEFGVRNANATPILAPPPEFSDARDTHEAATRFNQGQGHGAHAMMSSMYGGGGGDPYHSQGQQQQGQFMRQTPMYRSVSQAHSSSSSMYSGYPTMTRQQYQQHQQQQQLHHHQQQQMQLQQAQQQQQQHSYGTIQGQGVGGTRVVAGSGLYSTVSNPAAAAVSSYGHYQTLVPKSSSSSSSQQPPPVPQTAPPSYGHHPKCYYYHQQGPGSTNTSSPSPAPSTASSISTSNPNPNSAKLHPVHRYTPDLYESTNGPRIVGTIPKKGPGGVDHYEVIHSNHHQQQQRQTAMSSAVVSSNASKIRREFRNKTLGEWTVGDSCDWLDSLFMPEYKGIFTQVGIDGKKLLRMDNATLLDLGIKKLGHRMNIEKSLKKYLPASASKS